MKFRYPFIVLLCLFLSPRSYGQLITPNVFLQGAYVEVGMAPNGSWGAGAAPAGYHPRTSSTATPGTIGSNIACVYDFGHDGWSTGSPFFFGDYIFPGTPFEGWAIQVNGVYSHGYYSDGPSTFYNAPGGTLTGGNVAYSVVPPLAPCGSTMNYGNSTTGVWMGSAGPAGALSIWQATVVDTLASWVYVNTVFKNNSTSPMPDLYYLRTCDPDNDVTYLSSLGFGSFTTNNSITWQNDADHRVLVGSYGSQTYNNAYLALATKDCRAKALIYQTWPPVTVAGNNLDLMYAGTATGLGSTWYAQGQVTVNQDIAIGLVYKLGTLGPGDSTMISYAYIFKDSSCIDSVFPEPQLVVNCIAQPPSGPAPAPTFDTFNKCDNPGVSSLPVSINYGNTKNWSGSKWTWAPATGLSSTTGVSNNINLTAVSGITTYTITGTDSAYGMNTCANRVFYLTIIPGCVDAVNNSPICAGDTLKLNSPGDSLGATYYWYGPTGFFATGQSAIRFPTTALDSGWYHVVKVTGGSQDTGHTHVVIKPKPVINLTSNSPLCSGKTLTLTATPDSVGEIWSWTGPLGFTAGTANPTRPGVHVNYSGAYWVKAVFKGCKDSAFINVVVDSTPEVPTVSSNSPVCSQSPLLLSAVTATAGVSYSWTGPAGFSSALQNPSIVSANTSASGTYTAMVTLGACTNTATLNAVVDSTPYQPALTSNSPVCSGNPLNFTATSTAGTTNFSWSGPAGFSAFTQNPTINPAHTMHSGTYTVTASRTYSSGSTVHTCTSVPATITVVVDSTPVAPSAFSNSPGAPGVSICEGDTLKLFANHVTPGVTYVWSGPNSFASTLQNPIITNVTAAAAGLYQVMTYLGPCSSSTTISVFIKPTPTLTATSNTPVCSGDTLKLFSTSSTGATFSWIGPYTFLSPLQNPLRVPANIEQSGVYTVTVTVNGCKNSARDTVVVNQTPKAPTLKWLEYCQYFDSKALQPMGDNLLWYPSAAPGAVGSPLAPVPPTNLAPSIYWYYVSQTVNNCKSLIDSIKVVVNPKPTVTTRQSLSICPRDTVWLEATSPDAPLKFRWSPKLYLTDTTKALVISSPVTSMNYQVIATNQFECKDTAFVDVTVRPNAVIYLGDSVTIFPGERYQIKPQTNCTYFTWFPASGLDNPHSGNPVAQPYIDTRYIVQAETEWGCRAVDTLKIFVSDESVLALPNAFVPGNGNNNVFKILKRGEAVLNYFRIYDRWGLVVFQTTDIDKGWDGTYKGVLQPFGVYVYEVSATTSKGTPINKVGNVTLLK